MSRNFLEELASLNNPAPVHFDPEDAGREDLWRRKVDGTGPGDERDVVRTSRAIHIDEDPRYVSKRTSRRKLAKEGFETRGKGQLRQGQGQVGGDSDVESPWASSRRQERQSGKEQQQGNAEESGSEEGSEGGLEGGGSEFGSGLGSAESESELESDASLSGGGGGGDGGILSALHIGVGVGGSGVGGGDGVGGTLDEVARQEAEYRRLEAAEAAAVSSLSQQASSDAEKGRHARNQCALYEAAMETRIRLQRAVLQANRLPPQLSTSLLGSAAALAAIEDAKKATASLLASCLGLQEAVLDGNEVVPGIAAAAGEKRKRPSNSAEAEVELAARHAALVPWIEATADKWSAKTRVAAAAKAKSFKALNKGTVEQIHE
eukprot:UC1_evm1s77